MDEIAAGEWLAQKLDVPRGTFERIQGFLALLRAENDRQNLVSRSTLDDVWNRHVIDSAQLLPLAPPDGRWIDLGTGAGFPGLIVALLWKGQVTLVEQRRLRADFLRDAVERLDLSSTCDVVCGNAAQLRLPPADVISARAFAPLDRLFSQSVHLANSDTVWLLPKGRNAKTELEAARGSWQGSFRLEPSCTDPDAYIIVAAKVHRKAKGSEGKRAQ